MLFFLDNVYSFILVFFFKLINVFTKIRRTHQKCSANSFSKLQIIQRSLFSFFAEGFFAERYRSSTITIRFFCQTLPMTRWSQISFYRRPSPTIRRPSLTDDPTTIIMIDLTMTRGILLCLQILLNKLHKLNFVI